MSYQEASRIEEIANSVVYEMFNGDFWFAQVIKEKVIVEKTKLEDLYYNKYIRTLIEHDILAYDLHNPFNIPFNEIDTVVLSILTKAMRVCRIRFLYHQFNKLPMLR